MNTESPSTIPLSVLEQLSAAAKTLVDAWTANLLKARARYPLRAPRVRVAHRRGWAWLDNSNTIVLPRFPTLADVFAGWAIWYQGWESGVHGLNMALLALDTNLLTSNAACAHAAAKAGVYTNLIRQAAMLSGLTLEGVNGRMVEPNADRGLFLLHVAALALVDPTQAVLDMTQAFPSGQLLDASRVPPVDVSQASPEPES